MWRQAAVSCNTFAIAIFSSCVRLSNSKHFQIRKSPLDHDVKMPVKDKSC